MQKILTVIKREYLQIVRTKGFIIGTILAPLLMSMLFIVPIAVSLMEVDRQENFAVLDASGVVFDDLELRLKEYKLKDGETRRYLLDNIPVAIDPDVQKDTLNQQVLAKKYTAYIFIPADIIEGGEAEFVSEHVADFDRTRSIADAINTTIIGKRLKGEEIDPQLISELMRPVGLTTKKVTKRGVEEDTGGTFVISYFLVMILYTTLLFYGQIIMRGVIEEKNSKVVEIVLSSLRPFQLMAGKIFGIGAVGFTQYAIWSVFGIVLASYGGTIASRFFPQASGFSIPSIPAYVFVYFILFFILGYFLYSTIFSGIGSMVNSEKEAQQLMMPVMMLLVIPLLLIMLVIRNPNSTLSVVLSLVPFFAPILMLLRICILLPPFIQIAASLLLMVLTTFMMIWLSGKIYRVGILMYGKPPSLPEILKWMRYR